MENRIKQTDILWTKSFIKLMLMSFLLSLSFNMTNTIIPLFIQFSNGKKFEAGLSMGVFTITALLFRPIFGNMIDIMGGRKILIIGIIVFSICSLACSILFTIKYVLLLRILQGIGFSAYTTANGAILADAINKSRLTEGVGFFGITNTLSAALGPSIALRNIQY